MDYQPRRLCALTKTDRPRFAQFYHVSCLSISLKHGLMATTRTTEHGEPSRDQRLLSRPASDHISNLTLNVGHHRQTLPSRGLPPRTTVLRPMHHLVGDYRATPVLRPYIRPTTHGRFGKVQDNVTNLGPSVDINSHVPLPLLAISFSIPFERPFIPERFVQLFIQWSDFHIQWQYVFRFTKCHIAKRGILK